MKGMTTAMESNQTAAGNCSRLSLEDRIIAGIVAAVADSISAGCCVFVIFLIVIFKKHVFSTQRVILYLTITVLLYSIVRIIKDGSAKVLFINNKMCIGTAFTCQYLATSILVAINCILLELFLKGILNKNLNKLEWFYPFLIFLLPAPITVIPLITDNYGATRASCSIQDFDPFSCQRSVRGLILHIILWWLPASLTIVLGGIGYITTFIYLSVQSSQYNAMNDPDWQAKQKRLKEDFKYLRYYPPLFLLIQLIPIADGIYNFFRPNNPILTLTILSNTVTGLLGGFVAVMFTLDPLTRKRLNRSHLKAACLLNVCNKDDVNEYPVLVSSVTDSLKA